MRALGFVLLRFAAHSEEWPPPAAEYRPTPRPAGYRPTPRPVGLPAICKPLRALGAAICPDSKRVEALPACDDPKLKVGKFCEGDGECGTNKALNNCGSADVYVVMSEDYEDDYRPTPRPVSFPLTCPAELKLLPWSQPYSRRCTDKSIRRCTDPKVGKYQNCDDSDGACTVGNLPNWYRNCGDRSLYQVVATDVRHAGCPALGVAAKESCPRELDLVPCDSPGLRPGDFCEGDGECGTSPSLDNCRNEEYVADIYVVLETPVGPGDDDEPQYFCDYGMRQYCEGGEFCAFDETSAYGACVSCDRMANEFACGSVPRKWRAPPYAPGVVEYGPGVVDCLSKCFADTRGKVWDLGGEKPASGEWYWEGGGTLIWLEERCDDSCPWALNGVCDDGTAPEDDDDRGQRWDDDWGGDDDDMYGSYYDDDGYPPPCPRGTDCTDCQPLRGDAADAGVECDNTCEFARDGYCDDTRTNGYCALGTDCQDCGPASAGNYSTNDDDAWWDDDSKYWDDDYYDDDNNKGASDDDDALLACNACCPRDQPGCAPRSGENECSLFSTEAGCLRQGEDHRGVDCVWRPSACYISTPGCPVLSAVAPDECSREPRDVERCASPGLRAGDFCQANGECGTDRRLANCGYANIYRVVGALADFEVLVDNALANAGPDAPSMEGWWQSKAGDGWQVVVQDDASCDAGEEACLSSFRTADYMCTRRQTVPLGADAEALDSGAVTVYVAEEVRLHDAARPSSSWFVRAMLCRDAACDDVVARWAPCDARRAWVEGDAVVWNGWCGSEGYPDLKDSWGVVEHTFRGAEVAGARFVRFEDGGFDGTIANTDLWVHGFSDEWRDENGYGANGWLGPWFREARVSVLEGPEAPRAPEPWPGAPDTAASARGASKKRKALEPWAVALIVVGLVVMFAGGLAVGLACARRWWRKAPEVVVVSLPEKPAPEAPSLATPMATKNPFDSPEPSPPPLATPVAGTKHDGPPAVVVHTESPPSYESYKNAGSYEPPAVP
mmetsp:Transcript_21991/g.65954  ORF Transcript_21991/g.65954 Transcript_21991/m.65954 type:complete len:1010 (-) Transcript_21991:68-3097(-)